MFFRFLIAFLPCALAVGRDTIHSGGGSLRAFNDFDGDERQLLQMGFFEGTIVDANRFPYVVSIRQPNGTHLCSGSLILKDWVLTAARCWAVIFDHYPLVYIGVQNAGVESFRQEVRLATKMIPEIGSSPQLHITPLGLIHLNASADVPLPRLSPKSANPSEKLELLGFGNLNQEDGNLFAEMRVETHVVQGKDFCEKQWGPSKLGKTRFCSSSGCGLRSCIVYHHDLCMLIELELIGR
ncbi:hypothetical protein BSKO_05867 [Bryopsis sp. KO-2023]|nr:hypothetical protein BSKO_05867 [Bryopsis sp. KO-2023]